MLKKTLTFAFITMLGLFFVSSAAQALTNPITFNPSEIEKTPSVTKDVDCVTPYLGMSITEDTTLCEGTYDIPSPISSNVITIDADNVVLDCNNAVISIPLGSTNSNGHNTIYSTNHNNIEVKNCVINNNRSAIFMYNIGNSSLHNLELNIGGIYLDSFNNGMLYNITKLADENWDTALNLWSCESNQIYNNTVYSNGIIDDEYMNIGMRLYGGIDNDIHNNIFDGNDVGIYIDAISNNNNIYENQIMNSTWNGMLIWPYVLFSTIILPYENNIDNNYFLENNRDIVIGPGVNDNIFTNNTIENSVDKSIYIWHDDGFDVTDPATGNQFLNNEIIGTGPVGIELMANASIDSYFEGNIIENRSSDGLIVEAGNSNAEFLLNSFIDNTNQATNNDTSTIFNDSTTGNTWYDYDEPAEGCLDNDLNGRCDAPYSLILGSGNVDDNMPISSLPYIDPISDQNINEGETLELTITAHDANLDSLSLSVSYPNGTFSASFIDNGDNTGTFTWKPWYNQAGDNYEVVFNASDGTHVVTENISIDVNDYIVPPPTITLDTSTQTIVAGQPFTLTITSSSEEALASVWWGVREPGNYAYDEIPGSVDGTTVNLAPAQGFGTCSGESYCEFTRTVIIDEPGDYEIWANARDTIYFSILGEPHQASEGIGIPVIEMNVAPTFSALPTQLFTTVGKTINFNVSASDKNGDQMELKMIQPISGAIFKSENTLENIDGTSTVTGNFTWTPNFKQSGTYYIEFQVTDDQGSSVISRPIKIEVSDLKTAIFIK